MVWDMVDRELYIKFGLGSMLRCRVDGRRTDDRRLRHDSGPASKVKP